MSDENGGGRQPTESQLYAKSATELQNTLENILDSHHEISQRAIDLVKINILSLSVIVTGISLSSLSISLTIIGGLFSFLYSIWSCVHVYHPREYNRGVGRDGGIEMDKLISDGTTSTEFHRKLLYSYVDSVEKAKDAHEFEIERFQKGLWASISAILFFSVASIIQVSGGVPVGYEIPLLFIIPMMAIWGKDMTVGQYE